MMLRGTALSFGKISRPEDRILRVTNLHFDATDADIEDFFNGYGLVDWKRDINIKTGKLTIAYVLLHSSQALNRAIADLDYQVLLDRPLRVRRARQGFKLTDTGMLNAHAAGSGTPSNRPFAGGPIPAQFPVAPSAPTFAANPTTAPLATTNYRPPAVEDEDTFSPSQSTPRSSTKSTPNNPRKRVLLLNNVHPEANESAIRLFFRGFNVVDIKRNYNRQNGKPLPIAFVLLGSFEERNRAKLELNGAKLMGRAVELEWANKGIKVFDSGFEPRESNLEPSTPTKMTPAKDPEVMHAAVSSVRRINFQEQPTFDQAPVEQDDWTVDVEAGIPSSGNAFTDCTPINMSRASWHADPWDIPRQDSSQLQPTWDADLAHHLLRSWNLAGNDSDNPDYNVITEKDWYYFQPREVAKYKRELKF